MGLILDSSVLVATEREGKNARQMLADIAARVGDTNIALSVVTLVELAHGAARADTPERKAKRQQFIQELLTALPIHPITASVGLRVGQIDGENQARGSRIPLADLLIGVRNSVEELRASHHPAHNFLSWQRFRRDGVLFSPTGKQGWTAQTTGSSGVKGTHAVLTRRESPDPENGFNHRSSFSLVNDR
ncbi:MAG: PIN domain-containing protein [Acidobacteria bacterium]|nr:PIN domain-containing protein [Acidobacteriota bacterium]